ncbi:hypothetical protein [Schlesneria sp. DSM 10557]|uniref:hypothetical protein n=1 Tax=Schlesneria sp. DSM 10557 TaxID=3044399 RepID=UPI00359FAC24
MLEVADDGSFTWSDKVDFSKWSLDSLQQMKHLAELVTPSACPRLGKWLHDAIDRELQHRADMVIAGTPDIPSQPTPICFLSWDDASLAEALGMVYGWTSSFKVDYPEVAETFSEMCDGLVMWASRRLYYLGTSTPPTTTPIPSVN